MAENNLWDRMEKIKPTLKKQTAYKNYVISGGTLSKSEWEKVNKNNHRGGYESYRTPPHDFLLFL